MQALTGDLLVEQDVNYEPSGHYTERHFVLFPLCGLKWFSSNPVLHPSFSAHNSEGILLPHFGDSELDLECGWVFGGLTRVTKVSLETELSFEKGEKESFLYPFTLTLKCNDETTTVRFASMDSDISQMWVQALEKYYSVQLYVLACSENDVIPSPEIFVEISDVISRQRIGMFSSSSPSPSPSPSSSSPDKEKHANSRKIYSVFLTPTIYSIYYSISYTPDLLNIQLTNPILQSIIDFIKLSTPHGAVVDILSIRCADLGDEHMEKICDLLQLLPHLSSLILCDNELADEGVTLLSEALMTLTGLRKLDLSRNCIGDDGVDVLTKTLVSLTDMVNLNLSNNRLGPASMRPLSLRLAIHTAKYTHIYLANNALGDSAAALASLLMHNTPPCIQTLDLSFTGMSDVGVREVSSHIARCSTLRRIILRGTLLLLPPLLLLLVLVLLHLLPNDDCTN